MIFLNLRKGLSASIPPCNFLILLSLYVKTSIIKKPYVSEPVLCRKIAVANPSTP
jgi:hypothetical protein